MVGFVALFGMAARNTILLVSHYDHLVRRGGRSRGISTTAMRGAEERLTPVLLTALLTGLALLPVALQLHQPGHEIEGPMAVVILGGLGVLYAGEPAADSAAGGALAAAASAAGLEVGINSSEDARQ